MRREDCLTCMDAGVVEVTDGTVKTLAYCYCRLGKRFHWQLETIPLVGFKHEPLNWHEYKSKIGTGDYVEKIQWHLARVRNAESFWKQQLEAKGGE